MERANIVRDQAAGGRAEGEITLLEIVQAVEQRRQAKVVDDAWLDAKFAQLPPPAPDECGEAPVQTEAGANEVEDGDGRDEG